MGASKDSNIRKCGEILMHINNVNKRSKMYTFHCAFCGADCDQLKKFSIHLEEEHLHHFTDELEETKIVMEPKIKLEENIEIEETPSLNNFFDCTNPNNCNEDPLESMANETKIDKSSTDIIVVNGNEENFNKEFENFQLNEIFDQSSLNESDIEELPTDNAKQNSSAKRKQKSEKMKISQNKHIEDGKLRIIIELYKKYELLWQVKNIAFGIPIKREEEIKKMIEDLKVNHNIEKSLDDVQDHINYINRLYSKDKEQQLKCELEKAEFKPLSDNFEKLSFLSDSQGPFKCSTCNVIIKKFEQYHIHVAEHNNTLAFKCTLCEKGFDKFNKFVLHNKRHLGVHTFHCNVCGKGYPFKAELDWHLTSHTGDKPYLCQICGAGFRSRHGYDNHIRRHEKRFRYECHICKHGFNHLHRLNSHVKSHLNIRDILCNVCGKGFTARKYLLRHKLIHGNEKRYKCSDCGKAFAQDAGLRAHRKQHQPYSALAENKNDLVCSFLDM